jgi:hypothetical protein
MTSRGGNTQPPRPDEMLEQGDTIDWEDRPARMIPRLSRLGSTRRIHRADYSGGWRSIGSIREARREEDWLYKEILTRLV